MIITTNGGQVYEVNTPEEVVALLMDPQSVKQQPMPRTREQLLAELALLGTEADRSGCAMLSAAILTVLRAARYPDATKSHLISLGQHMVAACGPLVE